jgi:hypothetical protein
MKFGIRVFYKDLFGKCEFSRNWRSDRSTLHKGTNGYLPTHSIFFTSLGKILYKISPGNVIGQLKFRENRCSEIYNLIGM